MDIENIYRLASKGADLLARGDDFSESLAVRDLIVAHRELAVLSPLGAGVAAPVAEWKCPTCGNGPKFDHRGCNPFGWWNEQYGNFTPSNRLSMPIEETPAFQRGELLPLYTTQSVANWIRNNYQDHANLDSLLEAMLTTLPEAAAQEGDSTFDADAAKRLRLIAKLLRLDSVIPDDDATMMGALFAVLGMVRHEVEALVAAKQAQPVVELAAQLVENIEIKRLNGAYTSGQIDYEIDSIARQIRALATSVEPKRGTTHSQPAADVVAYRMEMRAGDYSYMDAKHWSYNGQHYTGSRVHELVLGRCIQNPGVPIEVAAVFPSMWSGVRPDAAAPSEGAQAEREAEQRKRMEDRFANRVPSPTTADFDLPAQSDAIEEAQAEKCKAVSQAVTPLASSADATYENGPEGMPRVKRMTDITLDLVFIGSGASGLVSMGEEGREMLHLFAHAVAEETLARLPSWPVATPAAAVELPEAATEKELLPCPFCEGVPELYIGCSDVFVTCTSCGSYGSTYIHNRHPDFPNMDTAKSKAIAAWNRRAAVALAAAQEKKNEN